MTKTMKKGLLVVLFVVMAVAIGLGFASYASFGTAKAAVNQAYVDQFKGYMDSFKDVKTFDDATLFSKAEGPESSYKYGLWNAYTGAKRLYGNFSSEDKAALGDAGSTFNKVDAVMGKYYAIVAQINSTLYGLDESNTYSDNTKVVATRTAYENLKTEDPTYGEAKQEYVGSQTNYLANLTAAEARMTELKANIDAIVSAIKSIQYYNGSDMTASPEYSVEAGGAEKVNTNIVIDSETTIKAVETAITTAGGTITAGKTLGDVTVTEFVDKAFVENWDVYEAAQKYLAEQKKKAQNVIDLIKETFDHKTDNVKYYTIQKQIDACRTAYNALEDTTGHNDLKGLVSNYATLQAMEQYITNLETKIAAVEALIVTLESQDAKFNDEYKTAIENAEKAWEKLDADVKAYDEARYATDAAGKGTYEDVVAGEAFGGEFDEFNKFFIVDKFDVMKKARAQYNAWKAEVDELVEKVKAMIAADEAHENITDKFNEINSKYTDPTQLTAEQKNVFKATEVDFQESTSTCEDVMTYYSNFVDRMQALTSNLDNDIQALYNATVNEGLCVYSQRAKVAELRKTYDELIETTPEAAPYVTRYDDLVTMEAEVKAEDELIEAWIAKVEAVKLPVSVANWNLVDEAETAFNAILHVTVGAEGATTPSDGGKTLQALVSGTHAGKTIGSGDAEGKDIDQAYVDYQAALTARKTLKDAIQAAVTAMTAITIPEKDLDLPDVPDWVAVVDAATTAYDAIGDEKSAENVVFSGAQEYLQEQNAAVYEKYLLALSYKAAYEVEAAIDKLSKTPKTGLTEAKDVKDVVLGDKEDIAEARKLYDAYINNDAIETKKDIRNYAILEAAEAAFDELVATLNDWMLRVYKLYATEAELAELQDLTGASLTTALEAAFAKLTDYAYPLNVYDPAKKPDEFKNGEFSTVSLEKEYTAFDTDEHNNEQEYVKAAHDALDKLKANWETAKAALQKRINDINAKVATGLTSADLDEVQAIQDIYGKLHQSQKDEIENYTQFQEAVDDKLAFDAFHSMYTELYEQVVTNGNISALTGYYIAVVRNVYNSFSSEIKAQFTDYSEKMEAVQAAFDAAVEDGSAVSLGKVSEDLQALRDEYDAKVKELEGTIAELQAGLTALEQAYKDADAVLKAELEKAYKDADAALKAELEKAYKDADAALKAELEKAYKDADAALKAELEQAYKDADAALKAELKKEIEDQKAALEAEITKLQNSLKTLNEETIPALDGRIQALESAKTKLEGDISDLNTKLASAKTDLEGKIKAAQDALTKADGELQGKIDKLTSDLDAAKKDLQSKIDTLTSDLEAAKKASDDAVKALEGKIDQLTSDLEAAKKASDDAVKALEEKMNKADEQLNSRIDKLNTTVTAVSVVFSILLAGAIVCIVLLFIKKKA